MSVFRNLLGLRPKLGRVLILSVWLLFIFLVIKGYSDGPHVNTNDAERHIDNINEHTIENIEIKEDLKTVIDPVTQRQNQKDTKAVFRIPDDLKKKVDKITYKWDKSVLYADFDGEDVNEVEIYEDSDDVEETKDVSKNVFDMSVAEYESVSKYVDDWELYTYQYMEKGTDEEGEFGKPVHIEPLELSRYYRSRFVEGWNEYGLNQYASDLISVNRSLPDPRDRECLHFEYGKRLPDVSVIIPFYNEAWSVLLRTVYSVYNRTPPNLLREIILIDDNSNRLHLGQPLDKYLSKFEKVKIVRLSKRGGCTAARIAGNKAANATVLVFLESNMECNKGWLEPLLDRIVQNKTRVVSPVVDFISGDTFEYTFQPSTGINIGGFNWNLDIEWHLALTEELQHERQYQHYRPLSTPTNDGIFAVRKDFFTYIGGYEDPEGITGTENLELSFRIWMCGGSMEIVPCSHVGQVFRERSLCGMQSPDKVKRNKMRMAEVWMDEYKYYLKTGLHVQMDIGDLTSRKVLRQTLNCMSFDWYLKNVYKQVFIPGESYSSGVIKNNKINVCLDTESSSDDNMEISAGTCQSDVKSQIWIHTYRKEIRRDKYCLDYFVNKNQVMTSLCHGQGGNQHWEYTQNNTLYNRATKKCLTLALTQTFVIMETCAGSLNQTWTWNRQPAEGPRRS